MFESVFRCWIAVIFCWGLLPVHSQAAPPIDISLVGAHARVDLIKTLKQRDWTVSETDQQLLWTLFWRSRLALLAEDPDVFERVLDIQQSLATKSPVTFALRFQHVQTPILVHTAKTLLMQQGYVEEDDIDSTQILQAIEQINQASEIYLDKPDIWIHCWKSMGGSVGFELYRLTLTELAKDIHSEVARQKIIDEYNLTDSPTLSCPISKPGQVAGQGSPTEPVANIVPPSTQSSYLPILLTMTITVVFWVLYRQKRTKFILPLLTIMILEILVGLFVPPLRETTPWFSTTNWQVVPWIEKDGYYWTEGAYLRAQKIPKTTDRKRLVILGASSAHGSNELWENSFAGLLEHITAWDVVNLGIGGTTSSGLVSLLPYIKSIQPDALVIYYGHNELHQIRQLSNVSSAQLNFYRVQHILRSSSLYSWLYTIIKSPQKTSSTMEQSTQVQSILSQRDLTAFAQTHFESNMSVVLEQLNGIPTIMLNPPTNYPVAPMEHSPSIATTIQQAQMRIDKHSDATTIHSSIRESLHELVAQYPVYYWDLDEHFHRHSPDGISANGLFWDELHPSALGHQWIANGLENWLQTIVNEELEP